MEQITYVIHLTHKERGVGFSAKQVFQGQINQEHSPIIAVRLAEHTSDRSELYITLQGDANQELLENVLQRSGRMPRDTGTYKIESIELQISDDHPSLVQKVVAIEKKYTGSISRLQLEKNELQERLTQAAVKSVNSPLEGLLLYFEKIHPQYSLSTMIEEPKDLHFVREVLKGEKANTFLEYHNYQHTELLTEPQLEEILAFTPADISDEQEQLYTKAQEARQELDYLQKIERAEVDVPVSLKESIIQQIKARDPERIIAVYDDFSQKTNLKSQQRAEIMQELDKYKIVAEQIELLQKASIEMPMIIYSLDSDLKLYLPVAARGVKSGFLEDLGREMKGRFGEQAALLEHKFIAYQLGSNTPENRDLLHSMIQEVPFTLRAAGVNKITPYQI